MLNRQDAKNAKVGREKNPQETDFQLLEGFLLT